MKKNQTVSVIDPAAVAERAMPGWRAQKPSEEKPATPLSSQKLTQLEAKFLGTRVRSAQRDLEAAKAATPMHMVKLVHNNPSQGNIERVVLVSGEEVVAFQG